ncbi:hypothetical protein [Streptacidiphilus carbonis]|uniref:hypothetical protein n=1 Tax=Streptacidiphilus carbonis TaxID=105422 RepID=UPI0005AA0E65|nr:hypothetical protein [Streptacidiphilus carbonis]
MSADPRTALVALAVGATLATLARRRPVRVIRLLPASRPDPDPDDTPPVSGLRRSTRGDLATVIPFPRRAA